MSSSLSGVVTLDSEVTNIARDGFWLIVDDREYFVPFDDYPMFTKATVDQIYAMERLGPTQFYWPELDVDLELEALEDPDRYSLVFRE